MSPRQLPIASRSLRWLVGPSALLILYASWQYAQAGAYWEAGLQLLMLLLLPVVYRKLSQLPAQASFTPDQLLIESATGAEAIPLSDIQAIDSTFIWLNQRGVFRVQYLDAQRQPQTLLALGGAALADLDRRRP
ncbi:hypothetical protein EJV47_04900 [Hymenobacter gummosus]|uniref:Uncharacterized protein n=1 Tax=Hymenobacter gummosus TaxID=1776032 RepID=A0A3S0JJM4_9BACT|nr:hypothetical protein [Hymenobacter gummosus]RTQ52356.1 hypothetical protein EJV47_04900 [Hymenobacter gummosus]